LPYPKTTLRLPVILSLEEVKRIIDAACDLFHRAILMTLYSTGMRCAELAHLAIGANSVFNICQSMARKAVIQKTVGCHTFRHCFAAHLLNGYSVPENPFRRILIDYRPLSLRRETEYPFNRARKLKKREDRPCGHCMNKDHKIWKKKYELF
jgi:integrase